MKRKRGLKNKVIDALPYKMFHQISPQWTGDLFKIKEQSKIGKKTVARVTKLYMRDFLFELIQTNLKPKYRADRVF